MAAKILGLLEIFKPDIRQTPFTYQGEEFITYSEFDGKQSTLIGISRRGNPFEVFEADFIITDEHLANEAQKWSKAYNLLALVEATVKDIQEHERLKTQ